MPTKGLADAAQREVIAYHEFLEGWSTGALPDDADRLAARLAAFDPDFRYIGPNGAILRLDALREGYPDRHGRRPAFRVRIEALEARVDDPA